MEKFIEIGLILHLAGQLSTHQSIMTYKFSLKRRIPVPQSSQLFDVRFNSTNSDIVAVATVEGDVFMFDIKQDGNEPQKCLERHHKGTSIRKILFDSSGKLITAAKTVKLFDLESSTTLRVLKRNVDTQTRLYSLLLLNDDIICAGDDEGSFLAWDVRRSVDQPIMSLKYSEEYLSGMDKDHDENLIITTSGDSTLTVFDIRKRKKVDPQSEVFDAGFQCIKYLGLNQKAIVGAEDGSIYIFNHGEWGYMSSKFPVAKDSQRSRGKCSIDCMDILSGTTLLTGCSDGKLKIINLYPHKVVNECVYPHKMGIESLHVLSNGQLVATCEESTITVLSYDEDDCPDIDQQGDSSNSNSSGDDDDDSDDSDVINRSKSGSKPARSFKKPRSNFFSDLAE